jgi:hypothetical protein
MGSIPEENYRPKVSCYFPFKQLEQCPGTPPLILNVEELFESFVVDVLQTPAGA